MAFSPPLPGRRFTRGFEALRNRNFRLYFFSQAASVSGTWMQATALGWLVVLLTGDGVALGTSLALQYAPLLIFGPWAGVLIDRVNVRHAVIAAQVAYAVLAAALFALAELGLASMPAIYLISLLMGIVGAVDNPARRALVSELVPEKQLGSAVSLIATLVSTARVIGPAIAAGIIAVAGTTPCFLINAISFGVVIVALLVMRTGELIPRPIRAPGPIRIADTLRYVAAAPVLRRSLVSMTIVGTFALEFTVVLPLLAGRTFAGDGSTYGIMLAVLSVGSVLGSLAVGTFNDASMRSLEISLLAFAIAIAGAALAPTLPAELLVMLPTGFFSFAYITLTSTSVQINVAPDHRGRVLALWSMAFLGTTMIGAPIIGWISNALGPRAGLWAGAIACVAAAGLAVLDRALERRSAASAVRGASAGQ